MSVLQAYFKGWSTVFRYKQIGIIFYLSNFILALFAALPVSGFLGRSVGYSMSLGRSQAAFDYTFWGELLARFEDQINSILDHTILFLILFLLISVFLIGGVLVYFKNNQERFRLRTFWDGCSEYFWRILRLTIYFLFFQGVILAIFFSIFAYVCDGLNPFAMQSEEQLMNAAKIIGPIYILAFTFVAMIQDYAKIHLVRQAPQFVFRTFIDSFKVVFKNIGRFSFLYLLNILSFLFIFTVYWWITEQFDGITMSSIMLLFLIGQLFVIARIAIKLLNLSSASFLYEWTRETYSK